MDWKPMALGLTAVALLFLVPGPAAAAPHGPAFGANRYTAGIQSIGGVADTDDYVAPLIAGERLNVTVAAAKRSSLEPRLTLVAPNGLESQPEVVRKRGGSLVQLRSFVVPETGVWSVRVAGADRTEGAYSIVFKLKSAPTIKLKKQELGGAAPLEVAHAIPSIEGALLDLTVKWGKRDSAPTLRAIEDPAGDAVPGLAGPLSSDATVKRTTLSLKGATLRSGHGDYVVRLGLDEGSARYTLIAKVRPQDRPKGRRSIELTDDEPFLIVLGAPLRGVAGVAVQLRGQNFDVGGAPTVLFGDTLGTGTTVGVGGTTLSVVPPPGVDGETVDVTVIAADGQAVTRSDYFLYAPAPVLDSVLRADGSPARGGDTAGGQTFRLQGSNLTPDLTVRFGPGIATVQLGAGGDELSVTSPAAAAGTIGIQVEDAFGRRSTAPETFEYKVAPLFDADPYDPSFVDVQTAVTVTVTGIAFGATDTFLFDGAPHPFTSLTPSSFRFDLPALAAGAYSAELIDRVGSSAIGPDVVVKNAPELDSVSIVSGASAGTTVSLHGGTVVEAAGNHFHRLDTVTFGGIVVTVTARDLDSFRFSVPSGAAGVDDIVVTDARGQSGTLADALSRAGYVDQTATRVVAGNATDNLSAYRGALGDLDGDGAADDLVIVSYDYYHQNVARGARSTTTGIYNLPGTRAEYTRVLFGDANRKLQDLTATRFPAAASDTTGLDNWNGSAVTIGDVDNTNGIDIAVGGVSPDYTNYNDVRLFANDGSGTFTLETVNPIPSTYLPALYAYDENNTQHLVFTPRYVQGLPTGMALGDIDADGDLDLVVGRDMYDATYEYVDSTNVDFSQTPPYVTYANASSYLSYLFFYYPATQVFENGTDTGSVWSNVTGTNMPVVGTSSSAVTPAFHARDVALGDLDGDSDLDMVVTWDNPLTVSAYGLYSGSDTARVATRVLTNDGTGVFSDQTATWLPAGGQPEFFQAHRLVLEDLDGDGDRDLVLLHELSVDAYLGVATFGRHALRILRNDHNPVAGTGGFVDVTSSSLPALPTDSNDNLRGGALAVRDVDGDGRKDILVGTTSSLVPNGGGAARPSTRLLLGQAGLTFRLATGFFPAASADSGEAQELLLGDLAGTGRPSLIRLTEKAPGASPGTEHLRVQDWSE